MAWIGRIVNINSVSALQNQYTIAYFDDADPMNTPSPLVYLHQFVYSTDAETDIPTLAAAIQEEGKTARASYENVQALNAALPLGAQVVIEP